MRSFSHSFVGLRALLVSGSALVLWSCAANAVEISSCRAIADDKERLACYDAADKAGILAPPPAAAAASAAPVPAAPAAPKEADFGKGSLPYAAVDHSIKSEPDSITAKLVRVGDADDEPRFELDNGQVWKAVDARHFSISHPEGLEVIVTHKVLGYFLRLSDSMTGWHVKRVR